MKQYHLKIHILLYTRHIPDGVRSHENISAVCPVSMNERSDRFAVSFAVLESPCPEVINDRDGIM